MTRHREDAEQQRANMLKIVRAAIRLKHSIAADEELNEVLPLAEKKWDDALARHRVLEPGEVKRALGL